MSLAIQWAAARMRGRGGRSIMQERVCAVTAASSCSKPATPLSASAPSRLRLRTWAATHPRSPASDPSTSLLSGAAIVPISGARRADTGCCGGGRSGARLGPCHNPSTTCSSVICVSSAHPILLPDWRLGPGHTSVPRAAAWRISRVALPGHYTAPCPLPPQKPPNAFQDAEAICDSVGLGPGEATVGP